MAAGGAGKDEIIAHIKHRLENHDVYFLVDTLKWLQKGGRINMATVLVANLMDIHPLLCIRGGLVAGTDKIRGSKNLLKKFFKHYEAQGIDLHGKDLVFIHSLPAERAAGVKAEMQAYFSPKSITEVTLGATIGAHAGPGLTGLLCYR